jgi:hypothetical protein
MAKSKPTPQKTAPESAAKATIRTDESVIVPTSARPTMATTRAIAKPAAMPFGPGNYQIMALGVLIILIGFFTMTLDKEPFGFGVLGITLGPILVMSGFIIEFFAILRK